MAAQTNHNDDPFADLKFAVLESYAYSWAKIYKMIERISLHQCLDSAYYGYGVKYVIVFEHAPEIDNFDLDKFWHEYHKLENKTDEKSVSKRKELEKFIDYTEYLEIERDISGNIFRRLINPNFINVYKNAPDYGFQNEWVIILKSMNDSLSEYIDKLHPWYLFQKNKSSDVIEVSATDQKIKTEDNVLFKSGENWLFKYQGKSATFNDSEMIRYIVYIIGVGSKGIFIPKLVSVVKGVLFDKKGNWDESENLNSSGFTKYRWPDREDDKASKRATYEEIKKLRKQNEDLQRDLEKAEADQDMGQMLPLKEKIEQNNEIISTFLQNFPSELKKDYKKLRSQLNRAYSHIGKENPYLAKHLKKYIDTKSNNASYTPPTSENPDWYISWGS